VDEAEDEVSVTYDDGDEFTVENTYEGLVAAGWDPDRAALFVRIASGEIESDSIGYASKDDIPND
jgi:hypothetical protein